MIANIEAETCSCWQLSVPTCSYNKYSCFDCTSAIFVTCLTRRGCLTSKAITFIRNKKNIIIFLHGLGCLACSGIDALPSFPGASTISSSSRFVVEGVFRGVWCCPFFQGGWSSFVCIWVSRLVFQRSVVRFLWLPLLFYPALCIP